MERKTNYLTVAIILCVLISLIMLDGWSAPKKKKKVEEEVPAPRKSPWVLRHRYTFSWENMGIDFDEMNGDWHIYYTNPDDYKELTVIEGYGPSFQLKSGEEISVESFGNAVTERENVDSIFGPATHFTTTFPIKNDIAVQQRATSFKQRCFVLFTTIITNKGTNPISIAKISPIIFPPVSEMITRLPNKKILRPVASYGGSLVFVPEEEAQVLQIKTTTNDEKIAFAVCPQGKASSKMVISGEGDNWTGAIECHFNPPITLNPGESVESDPILVSFSNDAYKLMTTFTWVISQLSPPLSKVSNEKQIRGWVAVEPEKGTISNLSKIASFSSNLGLNAVLIPQSWEHPLGSLKGNTKTLSRDMKLVIDQLKNNGSMKVGLTLNPWAVPIESNCSIPTNDGYAVVKYNTPEGIEVAKKRWEKILSWNPDFVVCDVDIPNEVLEQMNSTRNEALHIGVKELSTFFNKIPIYPMSSNRVINSEEELIEFCAMAGSVVNYNSNIAPVKINNQIVKSENNLVNTLLQSLPAPAVWLGSFNETDISKKISQLNKYTKVMFTPVDLDKKEPKIWHFRSYATQDSFTNSIISITQNVEPVPITMLKSIKPDAMLWDYKDEKFIKDDSTLLNISGNGFIGIVSITEQPSVIGIKTDKLCGMEGIDSVRWNNEKKELDIAFKESFNIPATLFIYKPDTLKTIKVLVEDKSLKNVKISENVLFIPLKPNTTKVDLTFN
ncbi:MAG TPA: hypothetical protein PLT82_00980 [Candidatus Hydrogenedens sp.]|nr:hypothetical protein [Candidatus Hydrogenedens sp.]